MAQMTSATGSLPLRLSKGETLVIKDLAGSHTVTGSLAPREDATASVGAGFVVYGPQPSAVTVTISTTGAADYQVVSGDVTPASPASGGGADNLLPFAGADGVITRCRKIENVVSSQPFVILDTLDEPGPGVVSCIYAVTDSAAFFRDGFFRVYVDGEVVPSVNFELHNLGTYQLEANNSYYTTRMQIQTGDENSAGSNQSNRHCFVFKYPISYKQRVRIELIPAGSSRLFSNVIYHKGKTLPWKLKTSSIGYANRLTNQLRAQFENRVIRLLERPAGQAGFIAGMTLTIASSLGPGWLENNLVVYSASQPLDGTADPLFNTSGTEDFFGDFYYFANEQRGNTPWKFVITREGRTPELTDTNIQTVCIAQDFLDHHGGIAYQDGAVMTFEKGTAAVPGDMGDPAPTSLFYCVWYYEPY